MKYDRKIERRGRGGLGRVTYEAGGMKEGDKGSKGKERDSRRIEKGKVRDN